MRFSLLVANYFKTFQWNWPEDILFNKPTYYYYYGLIRGWYIVLLLLSGIGSKMQHHFALINLFVQMTQGFYLTFFRPSLKWTQTGR